MTRVVFDPKDIIQALAEYLNARDRDHPAAGQVAQLEIRLNHIILTWTDPEPQKASPNAT